MEQPKGHFCSTPPAERNKRLHFSRNLYSGSQHAYTIRWFPLFRSGGRRPMRHSGSSKLCNQNLVWTPKLATNGTPFPLSRQIVKQFSPPLARSRDKANETRNDSSRRTQETTTPLARESVSQLSEAWDGCRIVPALRVENRFWKKEVSRAGAAVCVLATS